MSRTFPITEADVGFSGRQDLFCGYDPETNKHDVDHWTSHVWCCASDGCIGPDSISGSCKPEPRETIFFHFIAHACEKPKICRAEHPHSAEESIDR